MSRTSLGLIFLLAAGSTIALGAGPAVNQSARQIPVAATVDVVVVGGSTGAVAAAVAAAKAGAKVFLAAPRSYLGDDVTATLRLWLEPGEQAAGALAKQLFNDQALGLGQPDPNRIAFSYQADRPSAPRHQDTRTPSRLADLEWGEATSQSVQYDDDVNIVLDLGAPKDISRIRVYAYHQRSPAGYRVGRIALGTSDDKSAWQPAGEIKNTSDGSENLIELSAPLRARARYVKLFFEKAPGAERMLLGEIEVVGPAPAPKPGPKRPLWPRPMHVKKTLDEALLRAGVPFLYNCQPSDLVVDRDDQPCGVVLANRAGRQAVIARTIIDATDRAQVARLAGAEFRPFPVGMQRFERVVIGGEMRKGRSLLARQIDPPFVGPHPNRARTPSGVFPIIHYTVELPMADDSPASWAQADQLARSMTYDPNQQFTSDVLFQVPRDPMLGRESYRGSWNGVASLPLEAFRPKGVERIWVLGAEADLLRDHAQKLLRPVALIDMGDRIGAAAAAEARRLPAPMQPAVPGERAAAPVASGNVCEMLGGLRPVDKPHTIPQPIAALPVLGRYDVLVGGGGTAGAPAGIAAARQGAKTLVIEQLSGLGGVGTTGAITSYCSGNRVGFTASVAGGNSWVIEQKMEWWRSELLKAKADIWFGVTACGAFVSEGCVCGAVVATPQGRGVVLAKVVIDATGNADVAAAAGAECVDTDASELAMQGTGLPGRQLGATYTNTDYTYTDETDMVDVWHLFLLARQRYGEAFDLGQLVDTRQRRRIVGDFTLTPLDQVSGRTFPDTIVQAQASYDTHGYVVEPMLLLRHPGGRRLKSDLPYRCLLPKGFEGLLVSGIGISAQRDAQPVVRMQPDVQNQGYAAGVAAAMASRADASLRKIDIRALQQHLVKIGNLAPEVLTQKDSHPLPPARIAEAVARIDGEFSSLAVILGQPKDSLPLLKAAYARAEGDRKLLCAKVLGVLGDATGLPTLVAELDAADRWDVTPDWRLPEDAPDRDKVGWGMTNLDNTLLAAGFTRSPEATPAVLRKLAILTPRSAFSHFRALYLALESLADPRAARPLAELLRQQGMGGHAVISIADRGRSASTRQTATRELGLARALYRCGDWEGLGERTLRHYTNDLRGHFARHAQAVLAAGK